MYPLDRRLLAQHVYSLVPNAVVRQQGFTRKKARFFGQPANLETKTAEFLRLRDA
jgi:hypothetical protein